MNRHNGGPPLDDLVDPTEAHDNPDPTLRPTYLARYAGRGAPLQRIVGVGDRHGAVGQLVLLACGHWREIRDYLIMPALGRKRPSSARCGLCREKIRPAIADVAAVERIKQRDRNEIAAIRAAARAGAC